MTKLLAGIAVAAVAALLGGTLYSIYALRSADVFAECRGGVVGGGDLGGPFTWIDQTGETVTDRQVITKPSLLYFGYTFCPDVCPLDNARNAEAVDLLAARGIEVTPVFISIDPARDTPEVMAAITKDLHPAMIGLTGSEAQVAAASGAYRTYYKKQETGDAYYLMDHSTFTYLVLPDVGFVDFFRRETRPGEMAERVACYVEAG